MSTLVNWNGQQYLVPAYNDTGYAQSNGNLSQYLVALSTGSLQQIGGLFQLTADADFGPNFGLVSSYYKSRTANIASAGILRLANTDSIKWRNSDNSADVTLAMNATGTAARTYTIPDIANSSFVMTEGAQTINGAKTFGSAIVGSLTGAASLNLLLTGGTLSGQLVVSAGDVSAPSIGFASALSSGMYRYGSNGVAFAVNGVIAAGFAATEAYIYLSGTARFIMYTTNAQFLNKVHFPAGSNLAPSITFEGDQNSGFYSGGSDDVYLSLGGTAAYSFLAGQMRAPSGSVSAPSYSFTADSTTGMRYRAANICCISAGGTMPAEFYPVVGTDGTNNSIMALQGGNNHTCYVGIGTNVSITTAKTIGYANNAAALMVVYGTDGSGATFVDLILTSDAAVTPTTISSKTISGSPAARTYSVSGGATKVAFASGTYSAKAFVIGVG